MGITNLIEKNITNRLNQLNTITLCTVVSNAPLEIQPIYGQTHIDGENTSRTTIQEPYNMDKKIYEIGDTVVVAFLQEVTEEGATRKFDMSDVVILGQASKPGQYSGKIQFAHYSNKSEKAQNCLYSEKAGIAGSILPVSGNTGEVDIPKIPTLIGADGEKSDWGE